MSFIERIRSFFSNDDPMREPGKTGEGELMGNPGVRDAHDQQGVEETSPPPPLDQKVRPESERTPGASS